jgi:hypothetical protein
LEFPLCSCPVEGVDSASFKTARSLIDHLLAVHHWNVEEDAAQLSADLEFQDDCQFEAWLELLQSDTCSQYSKQRRSRPAKKGTVVEYSCVTSSRVTSGGLKRPLRSKPPRPTGWSCLSRIVKTTRPDGTISAHFIPVHTSHSISSFQSIARQHLTQSAKHSISHMLAAGQSTPKIIRNIQGPTVSRLHRNHFDATVHRDQFVNWQDVTNLRDLQHGLRKHLNDTYSLHLWVTQLMLEGADSPVLYYKPPGQLDPNYPDVPIEALLLVLATVAMLDSLIRNVTGWRQTHRERGRESERARETVIEIGEVREEGERGGTPVIVLDLATRMC